MATKEKNQNEQNEQAMKDSLTTAIRREEKVDKEPRCRIFIQAIESDGSVLIDQYEHVTISNEKANRKLRGFIAVNGSMFR